MRSAVALPVEVNDLVVSKHVVVGSDISHPSLYHVLQNSETANNQPLYQCMVGVYVGLGCVERVGEGGRYQSL